MEGVGWDLGVQVQLLQANHRRHVVELARVRELHRRPRAFRPFGSPDPNPQDLAGPVLAGLGLRPHLQEIHVLRRRDLVFLDAQVEALGNVLEVHAEATGESRINTPDGSYVRINTRDKIDVQVTDWNALPDRFVIEADPRLDKVSVVKALKAGEDVPGIERTDTKTVFVSLGSAKAEGGE